MIKDLVTAATLVSPPPRGKGLRGLALTLLLTSQAQAEPAHPARLHVGDHVLMTHDWDYYTDRWLPAGPEINTACFRVIAVEGTETTMELVLGRYFTWWDETEQRPGYQDVWLGTTEEYLEKRPDAAPRELAQGQFTTVAGCGGTS
ncbi:MAG: hypothetical protein MUE83_09085 [Tabrizicola sp.]|nr:hypothetical protein [Tabrizicola sp.]